MNDTTTLPNIEEVLDDAWRLISFMARTGRPTDEILKTWLRAKQEYMSHQVHDATLTELIQEISGCLREIAPVRLDHIGSSWQPFNSVRLSGAYFSFRFASIMAANLIQRLVQLILILVCISVVVGCAYYTLNYVGMKDNINHLNSLQSSDIVAKAEKLYVYYPDVTVESVRSRKPLDVVAAESFLQKSEELKNLDSEIQMYVGEGDHLTFAAKSDPFRYFINMIGSLPPIKAISALTTNTPSTAIAFNKNPIDPLTDPKGISESATPVASVPRLASSNISQSRRELNPLELTSSTSNEVIKQQEASYFRESGYNSIANELDPGHGAVSTVFSCLNLEEEQSESYAMFYMPVLFGMLGTIVFHVRRMTAEATINLAYWRILLRVFLGGLAGAGSSVLLSSTTTSANSHPASGASLLFLAFILGFSLDLFFRILDRAVEVVGGWFSLSRYSGQKSTDIATGGELEARVS